MGAILWSRMSLAMKRMVGGLMWGRELIVHYQMTYMRIMFVVFLVYTRRIGQLSLHWSGLNARALIELAGSGRSSLPG